MSRTLSALLSSTLLFLPFSAAFAQQNSSSSASVSAPLAALPSPRKVLAEDPWEIGPFFTGGVGTSDRSDYQFLSAGIHAGKMIGSPFAPGLLRGQFEMAADIMPWWQGRTPNFLRANTYGALPHPTFSGLYPTGGAYNGVSITPAIFRWNLVGREQHPSKHLVPFIQGAGGLIWTNHKYPPVGPYQEPNKNGASVWNFTPQFGIGVHYFIKPRQSLTFQANAVHISSASLGDTNPGVNASVQFTVGYTWWK
jgi:lipid A 3-O-deacylase